MCVSHITLLQKERKRLSLTGVVWIQRFSRHREGKKWYNPRVRLAYTSLRRKYAIILGVSVMVTRRSPKPLDKGSNPLPPV